MIHHHPVRNVLLLITVVALLTACSGDSPDGSDASTPNNPVTCNQEEVLYSATCPGSGPCLVRSAELRAATPDSNLSMQTEMVVDVIDGADDDILLGFDLSALPAGAVVSRGVLTLTTSSVAADLVAGNTQIAQNTGPWTEVAVTYATAPQPSLTLGLQGNTLTANAPWSINLPTSLVQGWVDSDATNNGIRLTESDGTGKQTFVTSRNAAVASRPRLDVCYAPPPPPTLCANGVLDGNESDIDCGGSCSTKCTDTATCNVVSDCSHNLCITGICEPLGGESVELVTDCTLPAPAAVPGIDVHFGTDSAQWLTIYPAAGVCPPKGCSSVVEWHPGGGDGGMMDDLATHCQIIAAQGKTCITVDYRLMTGAGASSVHAFPEAVNDGRCATRWIRTYGADDYGLNTSDITSSCYSFGCAIAGKVATEAGITDPGGGYTYDDVTCPLAFSPSDAHPFIAFADFYGNTDFTVPGEWSAYSTGGLAYLHVASTADPTWTARAAAASIKWSYGDPQLLISGDPADTTVVRAQLTRLYNQARAQGVNATILDQHFGHGEPPIWWSRLPSGCMPPSCTADGHPATCTLDAFLTH